MPKYKSPFKYISYYTLLHNMVKKYLFNVVFYKISVINSKNKF